MKEYFYQQCCMRQIHGVRELFREGKCSQVDWEVWFESHELDRLGMKRCIEELK